ncbi:MAG: hypothetical protein WC491_03765 [Candidatus Omnitrophota bacterium]
MEKNGNLNEYLHLDYVIKFNFEITSLSFLEGKYCLNKRAISKIDDEMPRIEFKLEEYSCGVYINFKRLKIWKTWDRPRLTYRRDYYKEIDNPHPFGDVALANLHRIKLDDCFPKTNKSSDLSELDKEEIVLDYNCAEIPKEEVVLLYLNGGEYGRAGVLGPARKNTLFKVNLMDISELEKYHKADKYKYPVPQTKYYGPEKTFNYHPIVVDGKTGMSWSVTWYDFTGKYLPKVKL